MTIVEKWRLMMSSFDDIRAALVEQKPGTGTIQEYGKFPYQTRAIMFDAKYSEIKYPDTTGMSETERAAALIDWCGEIKEQVRQAIVDCGVECGTDVPLSEYGNKIRLIDRLRITSPASIDLGQYGDVCNVAITAAGGKPPYTWTAYQGWLPSGFTVSEDGVLTGTIRGAGSYPSAEFTVKDSENRSATQKITLWCFQKEVHFAVRGASSFTYDGQPHTLDIYCVEAENGELEGLDEVTFTVTYGPQRTADVTDKGGYVANINVSGKYCVAKTQKQLSLSIR